MLRRLMISHFRALESVDVRLGPLTVLIGKNDTGKSTFLTAIETLGTGRDLGLDDRYRRDPSVPTSIIGQALAGGPISVTSQPSRQGADLIQPVAVYRLPAHGVSMLSSGYGDLVRPEQLAEDGTGVPSLLDYLLRRDRTRFFAVVDAIKKHVPGVEDINISTPDPHLRRLDLVLEGGFTIAADHASAGVRLILFFIALAHHPTPPKTILLEEPENGIHPRRLADVILLLRGITRGDHANHAAQVVLSTHSPYLLDCVDLEEDNVLIFQRLEDGQRTVTPANKERLHLFFGDFMLGEVWFNQGEEEMARR